MRRIIITILFAALLALSWRSAYGFALLGPLSGTTGLPAGDPDPIWQTETIGYDTGGDVGTPKNVGQGYRWNAPVLFYSDNANFSDYFGLQGEEAIDSAFAIMNSTFTNNSIGSLDGYSTNLIEFPFDSQSLNYTAQSLGLTDLKSEVLVFMMEELGLAEPERYTWTLRQRFLPSGGKCPDDELYLVVQRNYYYTPTPLYENLYSPYVNDTLYTYLIEEFCSAPGTPPNALTVPTAVDPYAQTYTAVAGLGTGLGTENITGLSWSTTESGGYYNGLTRDDVGGLRYLMSSNNIVFEDPTLGSQLEATNFTLQPLTTLPLGPLLQYAQTNPPASVLAQFPNVTIDSVSNYYTLVTNWVVTSYFTNFPGQSVGTPPTFLLITNGFTLSWQTNYVYTFGNIVIFNYSSNTPAVLQTVSLGVQNGQQYPSPLVTNITYQTIILTNQPSGQYYLLPTNSCGLDIVVTNALNMFAGYFTNSTIATATNTGPVGTGFVGSESIIELLTNSFLEYYQCSFETSPPSYYQGIGHMQFIRVSDNNLDSLTGLFRQPVTNTYSMVWWNPTNSQLGTRIFQRVVTQPDIVFHGSDITAPVPPATGVAVPVYNRSIPNWDLGNILPNSAGPGTMNPPIQITFNTVGDIFGNGSIAEELLSTNGFLSQLTQSGLLAYGSFDGTTNAPVVYPNGTSIQDLENSLVITVTPSTLPNGTNDVMYPTTTFSATGGQPPYTWSLDGTQLPEGMSFYNGVLSGTPVNNPVGSSGYGTYDFTIQMTDASNRSVLLNYTINIYQAP